MSDRGSQDHIRAEMEARQNRMQDRHERSQAAVAEQLWETEQALSNRVRFFAAGVLAVSWGLMLEPRNFDLRLVFAAALLAVIALMLDFIFLNLRRTALRRSYRRGAGNISGIGWAVPFMRLADLMRGLTFLAATGALVGAGVLALAPQVMNGN